MSERCPTCGAPARAVTADEGTSHYELALERLVTPEMQDRAREVWLNNLDLGFSSRIKLVLEAVFRS